MLSPSKKGLLLVNGSFAWSIVPCAHQLLPLVGERHLLGPGEVDRDRWLPPFHTNGHAPACCISARTHWPSPAAKSPKKTFGLALCTLRRRLRTEPTSWAGW